MKNVLVVRPGALGDAILTLPALAYWKRAGAETLTLLATPSSWGFLSPLSTDINVLDFGAPQWLALFSDSPLPIALQTQLAAFDTAIVYLNADGERVCDRLRAAGIENVQRIAPPVAGMTGSIHAAERLSPCSTPGDEFVIDRWLTSTSWSGHSENAPYFAVHPGSGGRRKCWPAENFVQLIRTLAPHSGIPVVLFGEAESDRLDFFRAELADFEWRPIVQRPLREVLAILRGARFFVGNDAGVTHLAARVCPTLALFGPTSPEQWSPLGRAVKTVLAPNGELSKLGVETVRAKINDWLPRVNS
jgi:heptosyltransferase-2